MAEPRFLIYFFEGPGRTHKAYYQKGYPPLEQFTSVRKCAWNCPSRVIAVAREKLLRRRGYAVMIEVTRG